MQGQIQKKDKLPVVICPRCHAQNLVTQDRCGKCGFVFPKDTPYKEKDAGKAVFERAPAKNPMAPPAQSDGEGEEGENEGKEEKSAVPNPVRPQHIPEKGVSEGLRISRGQWLTCPRCGADVPQDAKRCPRCGWKPPAI